MVKHEKGPKLRAWRNVITREALRIGGDQWVPVSGPVTVHVTLTVPAPRRIDTSSVVPMAAGAVPRCPAAKKPDVDKLLRAVQDALSPRDDKKKAEAVKTQDRRFKLLVDDSLVVDSCASKTYPRPLHTHPWALPWPGAVIRVGPVGETFAMPSSSLEEDPGPFPSEAQTLLEQVTARGAA